MRLPVHPAGPSCTAKADALIVMTCVSGRIMVNLPPSPGSRLCLAKALRQFISPVMIGQWISVLLLSRAAATQAFVPQVANL
jgi:hypothetical protein